MKNFRRLAMLALAALTLAAAIGTTSASAVKFCSPSGTGALCAGSHGRVYTGPIKEVTTAGKSAVFTSGFMTMTCTSGTKAGEITSGETGAGKVTQESFSGCTHNINGGPCTWSTSASAGNPWPSQGTLGTAPNGTVTVTNVTLSFTCDVLGSNITCNYTSSDTGGLGEIAFVGGGQAETRETNVPLAREAGSGALCSSTATKTVDWLITTPSASYYT